MSKEGRILEINTGLDMGFCSQKLTEKAGLANYTEQKRSILKLSTRRAGE
jgi:hypothetical protein